jgi:hypothetical protein
LSAERGEREEKGEDKTDEPVEIQAGCAAMHRGVGQQLWGR